LSQIYQNKIEADRKDALSAGGAVSTFDDFILNFMLCQFGTPALVKSRTELLVASVLQLHGKHPFVDMFGRFCCILVRAIECQPS
jgi:hypothetical protein